jgi:2-polyprenyl-3-methyl-5-hydroxy-6-metoxy-1,4-benzoquinol methylase
MNIPSWVEELISSKYRTNLSNYIDDGVLNFKIDDDYVKSFSYEWSNHKTTQLGVDRKDNMNWDIWKEKIGGYQFQFSAPRITLDAGCGIGRFSEIVAHLGGKVIGVDLSKSIYTARVNNRTENAFFIKSDLNDLPFKEESFDNIISIGVLHHTPDPKSTFLNLIKYLKPGGNIFIWVYTDSPDYVKRFNLTKFLKVVPHKYLYPILKNVAVKNFAGKFNVLEKWALKNLPLPNTYGLENQILDTFDAYSPVNNFYFGDIQIYGWFTEAGLVNIKRNTFPTSLSGQKPFNRSFFE